MGAVKDSSCIGQYYQDSKDQCDVCPLVFRILRSISLHEAGSGEFASFAPCFPAFEEDAMLSYVFLFFSACFIFIAGLFLMYASMFVSSKSTKHLTCILGVLIAACGLAILVFH